jgi:hypothetical protein
MGALTVGNKTAILNYLDAPSNGMAYTTSTDVAGHTVGQTVTARPANNVTWPSALSNGFWWLLTYEQAKYGQNPFAQLMAPDRGIKVARALNAIQGRSGFAASTSCDLGINNLYNSVGEVAIVASMKANATQSLANNMVALMPPDDPASTIVTNAITNSSGTFSIDMLQTDWLAACDYLMWAD